MNNNLFKIDFNVTFPSRSYKGLLNKLKTFVSYCATVGIHQADGKKKVIRRYNITSKKGKKSTHIAGKSHRMNVIKLAYQNEFGARIPLRTKYKTVKNTKKIVINRKYAKVTRTATRKYSQINDKQGYILLDKKGNFVAYFKQEINIPRRPFLTKLLKEKDANLSKMISRILLDTFVTRKYTSSKAIHKIAKLIQYKVKNNVVNNKANHPLTFKAKGHKTPLIDEQDRIRKAIKYKVYSKMNIPDSKGQLALQKQNIKHIDKLLKSAKVFDKVIEETNYASKTFRYKGLNPNSKNYFSDYITQHISDITPNLISEPKQ